MEMLSMTEFTLRLRAGVEAKKFRYGYPWIYSNDIISDRRSKALIPGSDDAVFVFYYKKLYNFYGCVNSVSKGGPKRHYNDFTDLFFFGFSIH